jgi:methionine-rich copper-binding protein CopC
MKKRILMLLSVVAMMVMMLAMSVTPALAAAATFGCTNPSTGESVTTLPFKGALHFVKSLGYTDCQKL